MLQTDADKEAGSTVLFTAWKTWAEAAGEYVGSQKRFSQSMQDRGFEFIRLTGGAGAAGFRGVELKPLPLAEGGGKRGQPPSNQ